MEAKTGRYLKHIVLESPRRRFERIRWPRPTLNSVGILQAGFESSGRCAFQSGLARRTDGGGVARREAFGLLADGGWCAWSMNPGSIGIDRVGLIDENHLTFAVPTAFAAIAALGVGLRFRIDRKNAVTLVEQCAVADCRHSKSLGNGATIASAGFVPLCSAGGSAPDVVDQAECSGRRDDCRARLFRPWPGSGRGRGNVASIFYATPDKSDQPGRSPGESSA